MNGRVEIHNNVKRKYRTPYYLIHPSMCGVAVQVSATSKIITMTPKEAWRRGFITWDFIQHNKYQSKYMSFQEIVNRWIRAKEWASGYEVEKFVRALVGRTHCGSGDFLKDFHNFKGGMYWDGLLGRACFSNIYTCAICGKKSNYNFCETHNKQFDTFRKRGEKKGENWTGNDFMEYKIKLLAKKIERGAVKWD